MNIKHQLRRWIRRAGYDLSRFDPETHPLARRKQLLRSLDIDLVIDVGANSGQFAYQLRHDIDYDGRIVSFEPLSSAFTLLQANARNDPNWSVYNFALGDIEGVNEINIAGNSVSSSLLAMLPSHVQAAPSSAYIDQEAIEVRTLDSVFGGLRASDHNVYMKIDTQGFEANVLRGADNSLMEIDIVQIEMSLVPLYGTELLFDELYKIMADKGYCLVSIEPGFSDRNSGRLLQVDGVFQRFSTC